MGADTSAQTGDWWQCRRGQEPDSIMAGGHRVVKDCRSSTRLAQRRRAVTLRRDALQPVGEEQRSQDYRRCKERLSQRTARVRRCAPPRWRLGAPHDLGISDLGQAVPVSV